MTYLNSEAQKRNLMLHASVPAAIDGSFDLSTLDADDLYVLADYVYEVLYRKLTDGYREQVHTALRRIHIARGRLLTCRHCGAVPTTDDEAYTLVRTDRQCAPCECRRGACKHPTEELHPCPFQADVHDDHAPVCTCCVTCMNECARDI